ncbi:MAG: hypothetical protein ACM3Q4_15565 [Acidobacteriota bacterium]
MKTIAAFVCILSTAWAQTPPDSIRRAIPMIESMLEEAGEDRIGASVFLDEMDYYLGHRADGRFTGGGNPLRLLSASPLSGNAARIGTDSIDDAAPTMESIAFPLASEEDGPWWRSMHVALRSTIENSFAETRGMRDHKWTGSPFHSIQRLRIDAQPVSAGFLLEHDTGELFRNGHAVGYVAAGDLGILRDAVAGMFSVNAGEGLVLSRSSLFSKGTISVSQTKHYGAELLPYLSRDEFHYFRGAAATAAYGIWSFTGFLSHRNLPATMDESGTVTSFFTSGLFRTQNEISKIDAVTEQSAGFIAAARPFESAEVTFTTALAKYDRPLAASSPYAFEGGSMKAAGCSFSYSRAPYSVFGEVAGHTARSLSAVIGTVYRAARTFAFAVHLRSYADTYNNPFAHAFGERGIVNGERGMYFGFDWNIAKEVGLFSYVDHFSITDPELFTRRGVEYLLRADGMAAKNFTYSAQMKYKTRTKLVVPEGAAAGILDDRRQTTMRFMVRYTSPLRYTLTQRIQFTRVSYAIAPQTEKGLLAATDVSKRFSGAGLTLAAGAVFFDTGSADAALSVYEPDIRGSASTSLLSGKGVRMFVMADYAPVSGMAFTLRYGLLSKWNVETMGSGDDEILGNTAPEVAFQADLTF